MAYVAPEGTRPYTGNGRTEQRKHESASRFRDQLYAQTPRELAGPPKAEWAKVIEQVQWAWDYVRPIEGLRAIGVLRKFLGSTEEMLRELATECGATDEEIEEALAQ